MCDVCNSTFTKEMFQSLFYKICTDFFLLKIILIFFVVITALLMYFIGILRDKSDEFKLRQTKIK